MKRKLGMVMLVLILALSVVIPVGAKGQASENQEVLDTWKERGIFSILKGQKNAPNASMSKGEFAAFVHFLIGYSKDNASSEINQVVKEAKELGYWDQVFSKGDNPKSVIKQEEASAIMQYFFPGSNNQENSKQSKPVKVMDAIDMIHEKAVGFYTKAGEYSNESIAGNALINSGNITLENVSIKGDLFITAVTNDEVVTLKNVEVDGKVFLEESIQNQVKTENSTLKDVVVYKNGMKKSDWTLVWSDEFLSEEIDSTKWTYDTGNWLLDANGNPVTSGWGNNELQYYTDSEKNSFIRDGKLVIKANKEEVPVEDQYGAYNYTSAKLKTKGLFAKKYGKFEARMKLPEGQGFWPAFWMMPENDVYGSWPTSGEIDIMESSGRDTKEIGGTVHFGEVYPNNTYTEEKYHFPEGEDTTGYHTYGIEWEPGEIRWYVDGQLYHKLNDWFSQGPNQADKYSFPAPFDQEFYIILNLAIGGWYGGNPDETTNFPGEMVVDYVRAYELTGREYREPVEPERVKEELPDGAKRPLEDGNYIYDSEYVEPFTLVDTSEKSLDHLYWNFVTLPDFGGVGAISVEDIGGVTFAKSEITNPGNALWAVQLIQNVSIAKGGLYKVSFDAKSNTNRTIMSKVSGGADRGFANYSGEKTMGLTEEVQTFEYTFTHRQNTDSAARLEFNLGSNGNAPVWIGNVRVEELEPVDVVNTSKEPLADGNHIYNGTFDQGDMSRLNYWDFSKSDSSNAKAFVPNDTRELNVSLESEGIIAGDVIVKQNGLQLDAGAEYELTFDARADSNRAMEVELVSKDEVTSFTGNVSIDLNEDMQTYTVNFKIPEEQGDDFGQLLFKLGGKEGNVYLDNVKLMKTSIDVELEPLKNGDFTSGLTSWSNYIHFDANAVINADNEQMNVSITNAGNEAWSVLAEQPGLLLGNGLTYELAFDVKSTVNRDIEVTLENAAYTRYFSQEIAVGNEWKRYSFDFVMGANDSVSLKYLMGKHAGSHDITIDNVVLRVKEGNE